MECVPPEKIDKTTYAKLCDIDGVKPLLTNPLSDNCKRTESNSGNNNNKPHHLFSVAALTDEVMHHSPHSTSDDYKPQLTNIKSPKPSPTNSNNKKRMHRRSEQYDAPSSAYDNYDKSSSVTHSQHEYATYTDRCTITTDNRNNETPKSGMMMNLTSRNNNNIDRIYDNMSKYSSLPLSSSCSAAATSSSSSPSLSSGHHVVSSNQNLNMNKMMSSGQRNSCIDVSSSVIHAYKASRAGSREGMLNSMHHNSQFNQFKPMSSSVLQSTPTKPSSSSVSSTSSLSSNINSNPSLLPHQNLLKQFMGIDSQTANQLFNDPRFMELYALTMATLNGSSGGGRGVDGKEPLSSSHRIPLMNHENTASNPISNISQNNNHNNNSNASNQIRNGCMNEYSRSDPSSLFTETM
nr:unnamed protein product [Trichobilharzia regenti]